MKNDEITLTTANSEKAISEDPRNKDRSFHVPVTWLRPQELQDYLNCNLSTLTKLRKEGILPWYQLGGMILFKKEEIDKIIQNNRHQNQ